MTSSLCAMTPKLSAETYYLIIDPISYSRDSEIPDNRADRAHCLVAPRSDAPAS